MIAYLKITFDLSDGNLQLGPKPCYLLRDGFGESSLFDIQCTQEVFVDDFSRRGMNNVH